MFKDDGQEIEYLPTSMYTKKRKRSVNKLNKFLIDMVKFKYPFISFLCIMWIILFIVSVINIWTIFQ